MSEYVIFDIDGTLADVTNERLVFIKSLPKNWDAFNAASINDNVIVDIYNMLRAYEDNAKIIILTARSEIARDVTERWLRLNNIVYEKLLMRSLDDRRADYIVKEEYLDSLIQEYGVKPLIVVDDNDSVIEMFRNREVNIIDAKGFW